MNRNIKKLTVLCLLIFSNILTHESAWKEIDGTIVVYKRSPYIERDAALCSIAFSFIWCPFMYYAFQSKEEPLTWSDKMKGFVFFTLPLTISTYLTYHAYTRRNMAQERVITLTPEGFTIEQGESGTWKQLYSIRSRTSKYTRCMTFSLLDNTRIKVNTEDMAISNDELINLIKRFTSFGPTKSSSHFIGMSDELLDMIDQMETHSEARNNV